MTFWKNRALRTARNARCHCLRLSSAEARAAKENTARQNRLNRNRDSCVADIDKSARGQGVGRVYLGCMAPFGWASDFVHCRGNLLSARVLDLSSFWPMPCLRVPLPLIQKDDAHFAVFGRKKYSMSHLSEYNWKQKTTAARVSGEIANVDCRWCTSLVQR
jgi:hypothetical protein